MIPGVISTGLESWGTKESSRQYFRSRLWGSWTMMRALVMDKAEWKNHVMLDRDTGLDPPGIKLRAAQGFDATDFFITGYWIWNKILENLASIGYDPTNAFTAAYDWRLSYYNLEVRDKYFTRLKSYIETAVHVQGEKITLASHSMGSQVVLYFFKWVESEEYGKGGKDWVNKHIDSWVNISGCMLGAVKGLTAVLSGEMRDTAQLNAFAVYGLEKFLSKEERAEIFRAMPGISSMLPKGGEAVWGNSTWAPDDQPGQNLTFGNLLNFHETNSSWTRRNLTVTESLQYLLDQSEDWYKNQVLGSYSHGVAHTKREVEANEKDPRTWLNPLEARLPLAPDMKIYCFYGVGKPTERSYFYQEETDPLVNLNVSMDTTITNSEGVDHGVMMGEGDGTVNLLSTGYMCAKGWRMKRYNPAGTKIKVFEMPHEPDRFSPRGGPNTGMFPFALFPFRKLSSQTTDSYQVTMSTSSVVHPSMTCSSGLPVVKAIKSRRPSCPGSVSMRIVYRFLMISRCSRLTIWRGYVSFTLTFIYCAPFIDSGDFTRRTGFQGLFPRLEYCQFCTFQCFY